MHNRFIHIIHINISFKGFYKFLKILSKNDLHTTRPGVQREALERARERLHETNAGLSRSRKILRRLYFGVIENKVLLIVIIVVELAIIAALAAWRIMK